MAEVCYKLMPQFEARQEANAQAREKAQNDFFEYVMEVILRRRKITKEALPQLLENLYDNFNEARNSVLEDYIPRQDFQKLTADFLKKIILIWHESKMPEQKIYFNADDFCEYFEKFILEPEKIPEMQNSGMVMAQFFEMMLLESLGTDPKIDSSQIENNLKTLARKDSKSLLDFLKTYQGCFEVIMNNLLQRSERKKEVHVAHNFRNKLTKLLFWLFKEDEIQEKDNTSRLCNLSNCFEAIFSCYPNHGLGKLDIHKRGGVFTLQAPTKKAKSPQRPE